MCVVCHHKAVFLAHATHPKWVSGRSVPHLLTQGPHVMFWSLCTWSITGRPGKGREPSRYCNSSSVLWPGRDTHHLYSWVLEENKSHDHANNFKGMRTAILPWSEGRKAEASKSPLCLSHMPGSGSLSLKTWDLGVRLPASLLKFSECISKEEETGSVPLTDDSFSDYWVFLQHCARN